MQQAVPKAATVLDPTQILLGELYAKALLDAAPSNEEAHELASELEALVGILDQIPGAQALIEGGIMNTGQRTALVQKIFSGRVSQKIEAFLSVLDRHRRMQILRSSVSQFRKMLNDRQGKIEVVFTTAVELDDQQRQLVSQEIQKSINATPILTTRVNRELIGGAVLRIGDRVYDASILAQLAKMKELLGRKRSKVKVEI